MLTAEGYLELETELNELKTVTRPQVIKEYCQRNSKRWINCNNCL